MRLATKLNNTVHQPFHQRQPVNNEVFEEPWFNILTAPISKQLYIMCYACGSRSFNPKDIELKYCRTCRIYHD